MENYTLQQSCEHLRSRLRTLSGKFIAGIRFVSNQLNGADTNLSEGKLRSSIAPSEFLPQAPDFPPIHDDKL